MSPSRLSIARGLAFAASLAVLTVPATGHAQATGTFNVTANVAATCVVQTTSDVAFGAYDTTAATNLQANGSVGIRCTRGTVISTIELNDGANFGGGSRRMALGGDFIPYSLFQPVSAAASAACAYTTAWGTGVNALGPIAAAPNNGVRTFNICGQTAQGVDVGVGAYSDLVTVTVNF